MQDIDRCLMCGETLAPTGGADMASAVVPDFCSACVDAMSSESRPAPLSATVADVAAAADRALAVMLGVGRLLSARPGARAEAP